MLSLPNFSLLSAKHKDALIVQLLARLLEREVRTNLVYRDYPLCENAANIDPASDKYNLLISRGKPNLSEESRSAPLMTPWQLGNIRRIKPLSDASRRGQCSVRFHTSTGPFAPPVFARARKTDPPSLRFLSQTSADKQTKAISSRALHLVARW